MKRFIACFMCIFMVFCSCTALAENEMDLHSYSLEQLIIIRQQIDSRISQIATDIDYSAYTIDGLGYVSNGSETRINFYEGTNPELIIPAEIDGIPVTQIHEAAFKGNKSITSVFIPETITSIPRECFSGCSELKSVSLPNTITSIGWSAFLFTDVRSLNFPEGLTTLDSAICQCASGPEGVVILPSTLSSELKYTFNGCDYMTGLVVQSNITLNTSACDGKNVEFIYIKDGCTVAIENDPFGSGLKTAIIPASVTSISDNAFEKCNVLIGFSQQQTKQQQREPALQRAGLGSVCG